MSNITWYDEQNSPSLGGRRSQEGVEDVPQQNPGKQTWKKVKLCLLERPDPDRQEGSPGCKHMPRGWPSP